MSIGLEWACGDLHLRFVPVAAFDLNPSALQVYKRNFPASDAICDDITKQFDGALGARLTRSERLLLDRLGHVDFAVGGPPCQGHSGSCQ
jgi:DNA (cytosine-5)-methyltransferase 1